MIVLRNVGGIYVKMLCWYLCAIGKLVTNAVCWRTAMLIVYLICIKFPDGFFAKYVNLLLHRMLHQLGSHLLNTAASIVCFQNEQLLLTSREAF